MANKKEVEKKNTEKDDITKVKEELKSYVDEKIRIELLDGIERTNKRVIREKNRTIAFKNLFIIILFSAIVFLLYLLNSVNYFDKYFNNTQENTVKEEVEVKEQEEIKLPTLDELKVTYSYLLDNVSINENSIYLESFYNGELTSELKNYLTLNLVNFDSITNEANYSIINDEVMKEKFNTLFDGEYTGITFDYNGNSIRYIDKLSSYISNLPLEKTTSNIVREIINIKVIDNNVSITTVEGLLIENKLYNVLTKEEIIDYKQDLISNYEEELTKITYNFQDSRLNSIVK